MRVAVTYDDGKIFQHFWRTQYFKVYDIEDSVVVDSKVVDTNGSGHGALSEVLKSLNVKALICGGIGLGAQIILQDNGIDLYGGIEGEADKVVQEFAEGKLKFSAYVGCNHHDGEHTCGSHGCGEKHNCTGK